MKEAIRKVKTKEEILYNLEKHDFTINHIGDITAIKDNYRVIIDHDGETIVFKRNDGEDLNDEDLKYFELLTEENIFTYSPQT